MALHESEQDRLLKKAASTVGYESVDDMLKAEITDSVATGVCTAPGCGFVTISIEPDCEDGWCEDCDENTVKSVFVLAGVI